VISITPTPFASRESARDLISSGPSETDGFLPLFDRERSECF
jgi:hypothetical protein